MSPLQRIFRRAVQDLLNENTIDKDNHTYTGVQPMTIIISLSLVSVALACVCLYCFTGSYQDDDVEEKVKVNERTNSLGCSEAGNDLRQKGLLWKTIGNWFSESDSNMPEKNINAPLNEHLYDKPPIGTLSVNRVQPRARTSIAVAQQPTTSENPGRSRFSSSSYIPEGFKLPFELSFDNVEETETKYLGTLQFTTKFNFADNILVVKILKARDLPAMDLSGTSDPFVKCCLLPDRKRKLESKIRRKTLNPVWNEALSFEGLNYDKIQQRVLYLQVFDYDRFSRNDPIGDVFVPLHTISLTEEVVHNTNLSPCKGSNKRGELLISLCYQPIEGILDVEIIQARNLKPMDLNGTSDPYVKIWVLYRGKRVEKKKTAFIRNELNPKFNEEFTFSTPMERLRDIQLEITVMDRDVIGRNDTIGKIYLGHKSSSLEKQHWKDMLSNARKPVAQWHVLKV